MTAFLKQTTGFYEYRKGIYRNMTAFIKNMTGFYEYTKGFYQNMTDKASCGRFCDPT
jgi:hypothetical protein